MMIKMEWKKHQRRLQSSTTKSTTRMTLSSTTSATATSAGHHHSNNNLHNPQPPSQGPNKQDQIDNEDINIETVALKLPGRDEKLPNVIDHHSPTKTTTVNQKQIRNDKDNDQVNNGKHVQRETSSASTSKSSNVYSSPTKISPPSAPSTPILIALIGSDKTTPLPASHPPPPPPPRSNHHRQTTKLLQKPSQKQIDVNNNQQQKLSQTLERKSSPSPIDCTVSTSNNQNNDSVEIPVQIVKTSSSSSSSPKKSSWKAPVSRHRSCPVSEHFVVVTQRHPQRQQNKFKEKITRVDMAPSLDDNDDGEHSFDDDLTILPPLDNCELQPIEENHHRHRNLKPMNNHHQMNGKMICLPSTPSRHSKQHQNLNDDVDKHLGQNHHHHHHPSSNHQNNQSISKEFKQKLTRDLDAYQNILKQQNQRNFTQNHSSHHHYHRHNPFHRKSSASSQHHCNGHRHSASATTTTSSSAGTNRDKYKKTKSNGNTTPEMTLVDCSLDNDEDSWEEEETSTATTTTTATTPTTTTASTTTSETGGTSGKNTPTLLLIDHNHHHNKSPTTPPPTPTVNTQQPTKTAKSKTNGKKVSLFMTKKSSSEKHRNNAVTNNGKPSVQDGPESNTLSVTKRRSTSFKRNVKIITPYEKVLQALETDKTWQKEIAFGRRIGLYRFRGDIGNGNFSQVKIAVHTLTKEKVAVKILDKSRLDMKTQKMLSREIRTMETMHHPNLIRIFEVIESLSKHFIVMELAPGGELFQVISSNGRFPEQEAKYFFAQIVSAIDHMHQHNLIHRDIKAENVFFSDPSTVKVGDFGFSTRISSKDELLSTFCGSPPYAAPELFRDESYRGPYVDYWALGVLLYFIVTGMMPFRAQNIVSLKKLILDCRYDIPAYVSVECCQLIAGFLQPDPLKRYCLDQARSTRWLHQQTINRSLPKYDLKNSYAKLIKNRSSATTTSSADQSPTKRISSTARYTVYGDGQFSTTSSAPNSGTLDYPPQMNDDEKETFHRLMLLGIDESILSDHLNKGSHSHIVGTFRIIMHRVLRESMERYHQQQRKSSSSRSRDHMDSIGMSPIKRSTSMNVAGTQVALDRIWAHYARKMQKQQTEQAKCPTVAPPPRLTKISNGTSKKSPAPEVPIIKSQTSNDSPKSTKTLSKLCTMTTSGNGGQYSPPAPKITKSSSPNKQCEQNEILNKSENVDHKSMLNKDSTKQHLTPGPVDASSIEPVPTPVEEIEVKETFRMIQQESGKNPDEPNLPGSRLSRSFRTLKQLLTENNICGNTTPVVQPQTIQVDQKIPKQHVVHKTTTLQIVPKTTMISTNPNGWQKANKQTKLWRSQTTPDVSIMNSGQQLNHLHQTMPCYCDTTGGKNHQRHCINHYNCTLSNNPQFGASSGLGTGNKKSFTNNRCMIA